MDILLNVSLGVVGVSREVADFLRLYGEGGFVLLFPSAEFSSSKSEFGGYGLLGFEFHLSSHTNYFIELGAVGTGARGDLLPTSPLYSNGFLIQVGYRFQF